MTANGNGWKGVVLAALISIVLTGVSAWFLVGQQAVSRAEVSEMIRTQDPYLADRQTVQQLKASVDGLTARVQDQGERLARMNAILERVEWQINRRAAAR